MKTTPTNAIAVAHTFGQTSFTPHSMVSKVDRICTGRDVVGNDIKVSAEPHVGEVR